MTSSADVPAGEVADGQVSMPEAAQAALHLDQEQAMKIADKVRALSSGQPPKQCACIEGLSPHLQLLVSSFVLISTHALAVSAPVV